VREALQLLADYVHGRAKQWVIDDELGRRLASLDRGEMILIRWLLGLGLESKSAERRKAQS
jgi:hypothetical protein